MGKNLIIVTISLLFIPFIKAQTPGTVSIKTWANDKNAAFSFSFDDGLESHYNNAAPILEQFGFRGSFYVISNELTGEWRYGTWSEFRELVQNGHEVGSHSVTHADLTELPIGDIYTPGTIQYELYHSREKIKQEIPEEECITIAYPFTYYNGDVIEVAKQYYEAGRSDGSVPNETFLTGNDFYTLTSKELWFDEPRNSPDDDLDELYEMQDFTENAIQNNQWAVLLGHEVVPFSEIDSLLNQGQWYPISNEWLTALSNWIKQKSDNNKLWVAPVKSVIKYMKERDAVEYQIVSQTNNQIQINLTDNLPDEIYNFPLTADITVPQDWNTVIISQGSNFDTLNVINNNGNYFIRSNLIPDNGVITINKFVPGGVTYTISGIIKYHNSNNLPIENVQVDLTVPGGAILTTTTNSNGEYNFSNLNQGIYTISFFKDDDWNGVNSTDALITARFFAGLNDLDELEQLAADVNNSGTVNSTDALLIQNRFIGLINNFAKPDWVFSEQNIEFAIEDSDVTKNIETMVTGDVNGSFNPLNLTMK